MSIVRIGHYDDFPAPFFAVDRCDTVHISEESLKSVAFIGIKKEGRFLPRATAFFVQHIENQHAFCNLVTAEHVISGLLTRGHDIWLRVNLTNGAVSEMPLDPSAFHFHPDNGRDATDVAVCPFSNKFYNEKTGEYIELDMSALILDKESGFLASEEFARQSIVLGGDIAIIGLFRSHYGSNRNIPIIRVGNISALPSEPVNTKYAGYIKAYLVETRSIAGLSGSPVFALPDPGMVLLDVLEHRRTGRRLKQAAALLGLMHGHFDVPNLNEDVVSDESEPERSVHTGIGIVVPVEKIIETINHPDLIGMRKEIVERLRKEGATADLVPDERAVDATANDKNPDHREDFTALLNAAVQKPQSKD
jgi:hypothetical protein